MTEVPSQLKQDNWALFVHARLVDPIPYTRQLVSSLIATMDFADDHQFDDLLMRCKDDSDEAFHVLDVEKNEFKAYVLAVNVLDQIGKILYNVKYATPKSDSFRFPISDKAMAGANK